MKKITLLLSLAVLVFSCSKDEDESKDSDSGLIGTWTFVSETANGDPIDLDSCEYMDTLTFTENTLVEKDYYFAGTDGECGEDGETYTYTLSGNKLIRDIDGDTYTSTYSINGDFLSLTDIQEDGPDDELFTFVTVYTKK